MTYTSEKINIGTVIHGTLRNEDLLPAFTQELTYLSDAQHPLIEEINNFKWYSEDIRLDIDDSQQEYASDLVNDLMDALNEYAPPHTYFGTIEGDGSDFGFWPDGGSFNETCDVRVINQGKNGDSQFVDNDCNVFVDVNDHGNITVCELVPGIVGQKIGDVIWSAV